MNTADAQDMAYALMAEHGVSARMVWNSSMWTNGEAFISSDGRSDELRLSVDLTNVRSEDEVRNTILHEIAHLQSRDCGHGASFLAAARALRVKPNEGSKVLVMALAARHQR